MQVETGVRSCHWEWAAAHYTVAMLRRTEQVNPHLPAMPGLYCHPEHDVTYAVPSGLH